MKKQRVNSTNSDDPHSAPVPPRLSSGLEKRLASYAMAAGAAGVSLLALAPSAKADIVYFPGPSALSDLIGYADSSDMYLGASFRISQGRTNPPHMSWEFGTGSIMYAWFQQRGNGGMNAGPLPRGAVIGPGLGFGQGRATMAAARTWGFLRYYSSSPYVRPYGPVSSVGGPWANKSGYLGFEFVGYGDEGPTPAHFGWAYLTVTAANRGVGFEVDGAAYNTVPGQPILAGQTAVPEPATLGLLALGSLGIAAWRRRKTVTTD